MTQKLLKTFILKGQYSQKDSLLLQKNNQNKAQIFIWAFLLPKLKNHFANVGDMVINTSLMLSNSLVYFLF